jgi:pimeloyl-ACP methyl ester carboxylesterase
VTCYHEFALLIEQAAALGLRLERPPAVRRELVELADGRKLSALVWGHGPAELVLLHGGAQNAHTWDSVALVLNRPLVAVDLPGHGHSDWRADRDYTPQAHAADVAVAVRRLAPEARALVGMSIGGMTGIALMASQPELVRALVLVDVTPGSRHEAARSIVQFVHGAPRPATFEQLLDYALAALPNADPAALRRGLLHNARLDTDGSWVWRHHLGSLSTEHVTEVARTFPPLWQPLARSRAPVMLVRGGRSPAVTPADLEQLVRLRPDARVEVIEEAGHSVQGDQPRRLAELLDQFPGEAT